MHAVVADSREIADSLMIIESVSWVCCHWHYVSWVCCHWHCVRTSVLEP
jgi:hypothetical protein